MPLTQKSDEIWYPANVYAGKGLAGVLIVMTAVLPPALFEMEMTIDAYAIVMTIILLGALFVIFGFSYRYAKKLDGQLSASAKGTDQP
ncbi:MAG: SdpI family protein [Chloroflexi bacterium]|nr:SdpI family protein [Chloroflexota bacterium]